MSLAQDIVLYGSIIIFAIIYYIKKISSKKDDLLYFNSGSCPKCNSINIENIKLKNGGCSGISEYKFECYTCGYKNSYNIVGSGCDVDSGVDISTIKL